MLILRHRSLLACLPLIAATLCGPAGHNPAKAQRSALVASNLSPAPILPPSSLLDMAHDTKDSITNRGFVIVGGDGHFRFSDGSRARFWGINVSSTRLNIPNEQIESAVANFAHAGLNMVRLEAVDNRNCLLGSVDAPDSRRFDTDYWDRLDYWMDCLRRHGIYYYLDLLDFRTFKAADGVLNADRMDRAARPYALFDRFLIQLQKEYATQLLLHKNRYSGLMPIEDPALALVEICNEHGFFLYAEKLETLVEPYRSDLRGRWAQWLKAKYGSREKLAATWGSINDVSVLRDDEDPEHNSVDLPLLTGSYTPLPPNEADIRHAPGRVRDGVQFLADVQRAYFKEMRAHLRALGLRCPVTAVVSNNFVADVATAAQECDFTAENWYGEGLNTDSRTPGMRYYSNRNTLRDDTPGGFAPFTAALRWQNKPVVIREWATTWPNRQRAVSVPEALAYASLQDYDAVLLFGYQTNRAPNGAEADALNDFAFQVDPTTWGLYALAGQAFLSRAIAPADHALTFTYTPDSLSAWPNNAGELYRAAWSVRLNNVLADSARPDSLTPTNTSNDVPALKGALNAIGARGVPVNSDALRTHIWRSDTKQITRNGREGRLEIQSKTLAVIAGEFTPGRVYSAGKLRFTTQTPFGALFALALDGRPLETSQHLIVKMVSRAENTGQVLEKLPPGSPYSWVLRAPGTGPVLTYGKAATQPTRVWFEKPAERETRKNPKSLPPSQVLLSIAMQDGTWEFELRDGHATLACDTPGINGVALGRAFTTSAQSVEMAGLPRLPFPQAHPTLLAQKLPSKPVSVALGRAILASRSGEGMNRGGKRRKQ
jgi:hypothetical protein